MEIGLFFTILGVILTLAFGVPVIIEWYRNRRKVQLSFVHESSISLFKSYVKNIKNMEIFYQGVPIDQSIFALKGYIHNSGRTDIDDKMIHSPLSIVLPCESQWLEVNIVGKSENVNISYIVENNRIEFQWDLLKPGELFCFETLYKSNDEGESSYKFEHRITNLGNIQMERISDFANINKPKLRLRPLYPLALILIVSFADVYKMTKPHVVYTVKSPNYSASGESIYTKDNNLYIATGDNREVLIKNNNLINYKVSIDIKKSELTFYKVFSSFIVLIVVFVLSLFTLSLGYYSERKKYFKATRFIQTVSGK